MFRIDALSRQPVYEQIIDQLERLVLAGVIKPGEQIPSVRSLSVQLSINPNTIQKAYAELDRRGILCSVPGRGCYISENARALLAEYRRRDLAQIEELSRGLALAGIEKGEAIAAVERGYQAPPSAWAPAKDGAGAPAAAPPDAAPKAPGQETAPGHEPEQEPETKRGTEPSERREEG